MSKTGVFQEGSKFVAYYNGEVVRKTKHQSYAQKALVDLGLQVESTVEVEVPVSSRFSINQRFDFLGKTVKMVAKGLQASAVISGTGGLGKSHAVKKALLSAGLKDMSVIGVEEGTRINRSKTFKIVKGYSTARGLYRNLWENNDSVIVADDMDSILKDPVALNLLKGALDSYDTRVISWSAEGRGDDGLPKSFIFTGRIIFVTNMPMCKIDQAIRSRSITIDVSMSLGEIIERMQTMIEDDEFLPEFNMQHKVDALKFIDENKTVMKEITLRTLITVAKIRSTGDKDWKDLAEYATLG